MKSGKPVGVLLPTQEEWNRFLDLYNPKRIPKDRWEVYKSRSFIIISGKQNGCYGSEYRHLYNLISFEEYLNQFVPNNEVW